MLPAVSQPAKSPLDNHRRSTAGLPLLLDNPRRNFTATSDGGSPIFRPNRKTATAKDGKKTRGGTEAARVLHRRISLGALARQLRGNRVEPKDPGTDSWRTSHLCPGRIP